MLRHHIEALRKKMKLCVALLRLLTGLGYGADAKKGRIATLSLVYFTSGLGYGADAKKGRIAALSLVYFTSEYCAPVSQFSYLPHVLCSYRRHARVIGCLSSKPTDYLPILAGIQPSELCRQEATLSLAYRI